MESSNRIILAGLVLVCIGIGVGFAMIFLGEPFPTTTNTNSTTSTNPTSNGSTTPVEHTLEWGVSVGDTLVYNFSEELYDGVYDMGQVNLTITDLPDIPEVLTYDSFFSEIYGKIQFDCTYANGSAIVPHYVGEAYATENYYRYYGSQMILPIGDWEFLASIFTDSGEVTSTTFTLYSPDVYYGRIEGDFFIFGYSGFDTDAYTGMRITCNMTDGVSTGFYEYIDHDWAVYSTLCTLIAYTPVEN
ncbi:MAG: hypothetical protein ACW98Y_20345 [Candidatus Thorarchaeota archaeon]|jgi:hypothetical protein